MTVKTVESDIDVMNMALVGLLGEAEIQDTTSSTPGKICAKLYRPLILDLLGSYPWKFASKKDTLSTSTTPTNEWKYSFSIDAIADFVSLVAVYDSDDENAKPMKDFERFGGAIFARVTPIYIDYVYDIPEDKWPSWFVKLAATALAAELAIPITDQTSKADRLELRAYGTEAQNHRGGLFGKATNRDSVENPTKPLQSGQGEILDYRQS